MEMGVGGESLQIVMGTSPSPRKQLPERVNFSSFLSTRAKEAVMRLFIPRKKLQEEETEVQTDRQYPLGWGQEGGLALILQNAGSPTPSQRFLLPSASIHPLFTFSSST